MSRTRASCLIISANQVVSPYPVYPLGSACIVEALRAGGHRACHFDLLADGGVEGLKNYLDGTSFDLVGISLRNLDTVDSASPRCFLEVVAAAVGLLRSRLETVIVLGGAGFSIMPEVLLDHYQADYGIVGEGESTVVWLAEELFAGRRPAQRLLRSKVRERLPRWPRLSDATVRYYTARGGMLNLQTKRGCPYGCSYCSYPAIEGNTLRYRDTAEVVAESFEIKRRYGVGYLFFSDSVFNDPAGKYLELVEELIREAADISWCAFFRPENLNREQLRLMKRAGLAAMELGTDAATDQTLEALGKGFGFAEVHRLQGLIAAEGIPSAHFIMFGGPGENAQTLVAGLAQVERLERCVVFGFAGIRILPGTALYQRSVAEGLIGSGQSLLEPVFYFSPELSRQELERSLQSSFGRRRDRIYPCHQLYDRLTSLHAMGRSGPLWDLLLEWGE